MASHSRSSMSFSLRGPSLVLMGLILLASYGVQMQVSGNPVPEEIGETAKESYNAVKDFFERAKNTFTFKTDDHHKGLTPLEIACVVVAAVLVFMLFFCCIGYFLCACVKELICCICCCSCCRD